MMKKLNKQEALLLLSLIVDNESSENEKAAFFRYIQNDEEVRKKYESLLFVKQLLKTKYSPKKAPDHLRQKVADMIEDMEWEKKEKSKVDNTSSSLSEKSSRKTEKIIDKKNPSHFSMMKAVRYASAAAVILCLSFLTIDLLEKASTNSFQANQGVEEVALSHFNSGNHISASIASYKPVSADHALQILKDEMSHHLRLPAINGADLKRILYTTFADGLATPVLEFHQAGIDEIVHIFAFRLDELEKDYKMKRDPEAVKLCKTNDDYHITEIDGKHVVSWRWGDYWYTAVSNQNGNDLIAQLEPMEEEMNNDMDEESSVW